MPGSKPRVFVEPGQRFVKLVVVHTDARLGVTPAKPFGWRAAVCQCDCGETVTVTVSGLMSGKNKSCGCLRQESVIGDLCRAKGIEAAASPRGRAHASRMLAEQTPEQAARRKANNKPPPVTYRHGLWRHPLYQVHAQMMRRCYKEDWPGYEHWGGRGIEVCDRWHDVKLFIEDIEREIGPRPEGRYPSGMPTYTLDRKDNDGNYEPGNMRWATMTEQCANRRNHRQSVR